MKVSAPKAELWGWQGRSCNVQAGVSTAQPSAGSATSRRGFILISVYEVCQPMVWP